MFHLVIGKYEGQTQSTFACFPAVSDDKFHLNMNMMIKHYVIKYQFIQNPTPQIITYLISLQINLRFNKSAQLIMYLGTFENQNEYFGQTSFGLLEKSQFLNLLHSSNDYPNGPVENNFEEIFINDIAPNCSKISICTQEDRSFESFSIADEFFGESFDCFFDNHNVKEDTFVRANELSGAIFKKQENALQVKEQIPLVDQEKNQEGMKDTQAQNSHDETKNIPKNYIKAIFTFILQNEEYILKMFSKLHSENEIKELSRLVEFVRQQKKTKKYTIQRLKSLWTNPENGKAMRIISCQFLRKRSPGYIFGSKIEKKMPHIKHRYKFIRAIENPSEFTSIK